MYEDFGWGRIGPKGRVSNGKGSPVFLETIKALKEPQRVTGVLMEMDQGLQAKELYPLGPQCKVHLMEGSHKTHRAEYGCAALTALKAVLVLFL